MRTQGSSVKCGYRHRVITTMPGIDRKFYLLAFMIFFLGHVSYCETNANNNGKQQNSWNARTEDGNGTDSAATSSANTPRKTNSEDEFLTKLIEKYGTDGLVTVEQVTRLVQKIRENIWSGKSEHSEDDGEAGEGQSAGSAEAGGGGAGGVGSSGSPSTPPPSRPSEDGMGNLQRLPPTHLDCTVNCTADQPQCLSAEEIFRHHHLQLGDAANSSKFRTMSPTILYQLQNSHCHGNARPTHTLRSRPNPLQVWGFGFLCVTLINLCSLMGMVFLPLMRRSFYHRMLMFMVALAVGTLSGSGLLFLIPESFEMTLPESEYADTYVWRSLTIMGGIYLFFLVERSLKMIMKQKQDKKTLGELPMASVPTHSVHLEESINMSFKPPPANVQGDGVVVRHLLENESSATLSDMVITTANSDTNGAISNGTQTSLDQMANGKTTNHAENQPIKSIAWMVIFGDGLHNFIDGLSIGAAFSGNIVTGISVSLAVFCEELPHELGDFAILLNSGMTMKQALSFNFLSACMCYGGLVIGVLVGGTSTGAVWIFAVAGGMFLYISLVDMLPEVNHAAEEEEKASGATWSVFFIQNVGLLTGGGIMVLLAHYGGQIDLSYLNL